MKLEKYLLEGMKWNEVMNVHDLLEVIKRDCEPFLNEFDFLLFRGYDIIKFNREPIILKTVRANRKPLDSDIKIHNYMDNELEKRFGWAPRSNGVFAVGDMRIANRYGEPCMFFPIGKYKYIWSPSIIDFAQDAALEIMVRATGKDANDDNLKRAQNLFDTFKDNGYKAFSMNEVVFSCKTYYLIDPDHDIFMEDFPTTARGLNYFLRNLGMRNTA